MQQKTNESPKTGIKNKFKKIEREKPIESDNLTPARYKWKADEKKEL